MSKVIGNTVGTTFDPNKLNANSGNFLVTITKNEDETYTADKTYAELVSAKSNGKTLLCRYYDDDIYLPLTMGHGLFVFSGVVDNRIYQINIPSMENITVTKTDIPDLDGYATEQYVEETISNMEISAGTFRFELTLEEDVSSAKLTLPVNWGQVLQFNIHMDTNFTTDMAWATNFGGSYNNRGTLAAGLKGLNIYGIRYSWSDVSSLISVGITSANNASDVPKPKFGDSHVYARKERNDFEFSSTTAGAVFPAGTRFTVWGVYEP